jgi:gliding motility-associated-like protein
MLGIRYIAIWAALLAATNGWTQSYFLNGTAQSMGGDCYQLTTTQGNQNGTVWYSNLIDLTQPFDLNFTMNFGTFDGTGADGMVFVLQDVGTDALGATGGALGFSGFNPSFGIEFDTWQNGQYGDLVEDHIGFVSDGTVDHAPPTGLGGPVTANINGANIEDGEDHPVRITWDPGTQIIAVYFDCDLRLANQVDLIGSIFSGQEFVYWGFTGSTGGSFNNQSVCLAPNIIATGPEAWICPGGTLELNVIGAPGSEYTWQPATFLSDSVGATVTCTPDSSLTYVVTYEGFCDDQVSDTIHVEVAELEGSIEAMPSNVLTCLVESIQLEGSSNFPNGIDYQWLTTNGNVLSALGSNALVDAAGLYTLILTDAQGFCTDSVDIVVQADFETYESTLTASSPALTCSVDSILINAVASASAEFTWVGPVGSAFEWVEDPFTILVEDAGTWELITTNPANGCTSSSTLDIGSDFAVPVVEAGFADTLTCSSPTAIVEGVSILPEGYTPLIEWTWNEGAMNPFAPWSPVSPQVLLPGTYTLNVVFEENGCAGQDSLVVFQDPEASVDASSAQLPNVITPNKDGWNERLTLYLADDPEFPLLSIVERFDLVVFNRWGGEVFRTTGAPVEWDGRIQDETVAEGTYYYKLNYLIVCGEEQRGELFGSFEVLR